MYEKLKTKLHEFNLENETVFLRVDLNVPINTNGTIESDFRIKAILPTLDLLINKKSKIILATHIDRPKGPDPKLSTKLLVPWFESHNYKIYYKQNLEEAQKSLEKGHAQQLHPGEILLLENLRFYEEESYIKPIDSKTRKQFAQNLFNLAKYYVNDGWGVCHRDDTSITMLPQLYNKNRKTIGLLIEKELSILSKLASSSKAPKPFVLILGGVKAKTKIPLIKGLIDKVDTILLCPTISSTFAKALNKPIGKSLIEQELISQAKEILNLASLKKINVILPIDYLITSNHLSDMTHGLQSAPSFMTVNAKDFPKNGIAISIGPKTLELFKLYIEKAKIIFLNGAVGFADRPETYEPFISLLQTIAQSSAYTMICGGESVAAVFKYGLDETINFCSTGGGATLAYLAGQDLPGLDFID